jgi:hypothetical protein
MENNETHTTYVLPLGNGIFEARCRTCGDVKVGNLSTTQRLASEQANVHVLRMHQIEHPEKW